MAGANAAGDSLEYEPVSAALTFHGMNTALFAAGDNGKNPHLLYKTVEFKDMGKGYYRKYFFLNNRLCGVILLGDLSQMAAVSQALKEHASYEEIIGVPMSARGCAIWIPRIPKKGVRIKRAGIRNSPWRPMETIVARMP